MNRITFLGDIVLDSGVLPEVNSKLKKLLKDTFTVANLEAPVVKSRNLLLNKKQIFSNPVNINFLKDLNIDAVCLANNHMWDYGEKGFYETCIRLKQANINFFGAGKNVNEATKPVKFGDYEIFGASLGPYEFGDGNKIDGPPIAKYNSSGIAHLNVNHLLKMLSHSNSSKRILVCHWGVQGEFDPHYRLRSLSKKLINLGFTTIIGNGPHSIQPREEFEGGAVNYSLGDFFFRPFYADENNNMVSFKTRVLKRKNRGLKGRTSLVRCIPGNSSDLLIMDFNNKLVQVPFSRLILYFLGLSFNFKKLFNYTRYYKSKNIFTNLKAWFWVIFINIKNRQYHILKPSNLFNTFKSEIKRPKSGGVPRYWY